MKHFFVFFKNILPIFVFAITARLPLSAQQLEYHAYEETIPASPRQQCGTEKGQGGVDHLQYLGQPLPSNIRVEACVKASSDQRARELCGTSYNVINPGNPEYTGNKNSGSYNSNELGYYYCIPRSVSMINFKSSTCSESNTEANRLGIGISYIWDSQQANNDGICVCRNRENQVIDCPRETPQQIAARQPQPEHVDPVEAQESPQVANDLETKIRQCITARREQAEACHSGAQETERTCNETNERSQRLDNASDALSGIAQGTAAARAGTGAQRSCFLVGAAAMGAREVMELTRERCQAGETYCNSSCRPEQADQMTTQCLREAGVTDMNALRTANAELATELETAQQEVREKYEDASQICREAIPQRRNTLDRLLAELGQTMQAATQCACQTSSAPSENCRSIPDISVCQRNPSAPGCQAYLPIAACVPGGNPELCTCAQNPTGPGCQQVNGGQGPPTFAGGNLPSTGIGSNLAVGGGGGGSSFGGGGGGSFDDLSLSGATGGSGEQGQLRTAATEGGQGVGGAGGSSAGAGGGGGSGMGNGAVSGDGSKAVAKKDGVLGGLFKDIKNALSNAFGGGGGKKTNPSARGTAAGKANLDKFKPNLRGKGNRREIASAHEKTLFELINECANGLRCKTTANSFIVGP